MNLSITSWRQTLLFTRQTRFDPHRLSVLGVAGLYHLPLVPAYVALSKIGNARPATPLLNYRLLSWG